MRDSVFYRRGGAFVTVQVPLERVQLARTTLVYHLPLIFVRKVTLCRSTNLVMLVGQRGAACTLELVSPVGL